MSDQRKSRSSISSAGGRTPEGVRAQAGESRVKKKSGRERSGKKERSSAAASHRKSGVRLWRPIRNQTFRSRILRNNGTFHRQRSAIGYVVTSRAAQKDSSARSTRPMARCGSRSPSARRPSKVPVQERSHGKTNTWPSFTGSPNELKERLNQLSRPHFNLPILLLNGRVYQIRHFAVLDRL